MKIALRLIRRLLGKRKTAVTIIFLIAVAVSASPYAFSMLGKWLVDEVLQVSGPPKAPEAEIQGESGTTGGESFAIEWKAKTPEQKLRLLLVFLAASLGIHLITTGLSAFSEFYNSRTAHNMIYELRTAVHAKIESMQMSVFSREQVGQLMVRVIEDVGGIPGNVINLVVNLGTQLVMLGLGAVLLLSLNAKLALVALAALPFYGLVCMVFLPRIKKNTQTIRQKNAEFSGFIVERLTNVATIKNYAQEDREVEAFGGQVDENIALAKRQQRLDLGFNTITALITAFGPLSILALGFLAIRSGEMTLGEVLAFYQVTAQLFVPVSALVALANVVQTVDVLGARVFTVLDSPAPWSEAPDAADAPNIRGEVGFDHVSLRYEEGGPFAVEDVTVQITAGATVCFVGPTGCGKSTLLTLLIRLWEPSAGAITLDGVDIRKYPARTLRRAIGNVLHECQVFTGTFAENIAYGMPDASLEEVQEVAKTVGLHDYIVAQARGYDTLLGRGGLALGTEELARLGLARALATRPAVLTIDDTYSTIEEEVERPLRAAVRRALADHTVLIATSRLSICEEADLVVVMQNGRVIQMGTHAELLAAPGVYRRMFMRQMGIEELDAALQASQQP
jgi:ATP-binding cassette, subfamily B, putative efflux pump